MQLLIFIILTALFVFAGNATLNTLFKMIQPDGALDIMFGWQKKLDRWYGKAAKGSKRYRWLHDALGGCAMCTSFWFMPLWFAVYYLFTKLTIGWFITDIVSHWLAKIFVFVVWYWIIHMVGAMTGLFFLTRKKNGQ